MANGKGWIRSEGAIPAPFFVCLALVARQGAHPLGLLFHQAAPLAGFFLTVIVLERVIPLMTTFVFAGLQGF